MAAVCYINEKINENTKNSEKIASFVKELSPEMLPRSGQRGRTSHGQLGFLALAAKLMAVTQISPFFMEQLNHLANSLQTPLSTPVDSPVLTGVKY